MDTPTSKWEWTLVEIKNFGYRVVDLIAEYLTTLPDRPVFQPFPTSLANAYLSAPVPGEGIEAEDILEIFKRDVAPYPFGNGHPRFYGWVNSPPELMGIFAEFLAAAMNPSCAGGNHAAIYVERQVVNWFKQIVGFPPASMGLFVSGGSMAALTGLTAARHAKCGFDIRALGLQGSGVRLVYYQTAEAHGCHQKAIELMGVGHHNLRIVDHDAQLRMVPSALERAIRADRQAGCQPTAVIASAGSVNTGSIDPLNEIADVCAEHDVWLHVDGAYGAPAILSARYREVLETLPRADSIAIDPHKWLYVPVEAGLILVRDADALRSAFSLIPPYLRTDGTVGGLPWYSEYGFQQTRGFRALKTWMALQYHGVAGYRAAIERDIELATYLAELLRHDPDFEVREPQSLSIVCFRFAPPALRHDVAGTNALNKTIVERLQLSGEAFITSTSLEGCLWLRACIINPRAVPDDLRHLVQVVKKFSTNA